MMTLNRPPMRCQTGRHLRPRVSPRAFLFRSRWKRQREHRHLSLDARRLPEGQD